MSAPPVEAVQARFGGLPLVERLSGTVWAENQIVLYPEINGRVATVHVESGESVERGQPLVSLADQQYLEQVRQAEAGLKINEARLRQANARLAEMRAQERRTRSLEARELISELEIETLAAQVESAAADVALAEAQLDEAAATLAAQEDMLARTVIRAPISGLVGQRNAEVGMQASPSTRLFTIGNLERVKIRVNVSDNMLRYIEPGQAVQVITRDGQGGDRVFRGELTRISPFLNEVTRSADAEIEIDNPDRWLRPGMFVPVDVLYGESTEATLLPISALFTDPNTRTVGVFIVDAGESAAAGAPAGDAPPALSEPRPVRFLTVELLARGAMEVAVEAIDPGEWVVTLGQDLLAVGRTEARIRLVSWDHVMALQGMKREDLLDEVLRSTGQSVSATSTP